jgi:hypothetical protein
MPIIINMINISNSAFFVITSMMRVHKIIRIVICKSLILFVVICPFIIKKITNPIKMNVAEILRFISVGTDRKMKLETKSSIPISLLWYLIDLLKNILSRYCFKAVKPPN